jgi:hypothetical protein
MLPRREEFFQDVRRAARLEQKPKVTTNADVLNPDRIAQARQGTALWLTPTVVARYTPEDFTEWPEQQQIRLRDSVESFRAAASELPAASSPDQFVRALDAFLELLSSVREVILTEWTSAVGVLIGDVEAWVRESGWRARRVERKMNEALLGVYSLPQLQVFADADLYVFDPVARFVPGAMGAYDLAIQPSHFITSLYRDFDGQWFVHLEVGQGAAGAPRQAWGHETFRASLQELRSLV